jgi:curved DNA-binding protein CbpA
MTDLDKYYLILELPQNSTREEIKNAYRKLARKWHPDNFIGNLTQQNLANEKFIKISEAYHILINENENFKSENLSSEFTINIKGDLSEYYYRLGVLAAEKEEWQEAITYFNHAIKINNNFMEAYFYRAVLLEKQGFNLRAEADYNKFNQLKRKFKHKKYQSFKTKTNYQSSRIHFINNSLNIKYKSIFMFCIGLFICLLFLFR